jgi:hypothetical protein
MNLFNTSQQTMKTNVAITQECFFIPFPSFYFCKIRSNLICFWSPWVGLFVFSLLFIEEIKEYFFVIRFSFLTIFLDNFVFHNYPCIWMYHYFDCSYGWVFLFYLFIYNFSLSYYCTWDTLWYLQKHIQYILVIFTPPSFLLSPFPCLSIFSTGLILPLPKNGSLSIH